MSVRSVQALSGLAFSSFLSLHALNTILGVTGPHGYDEAQRWFRMYYWHQYIQFPVIFGSLGVHILSSLYLIYRRWTISSNQPPRTSKYVNTVSWRVFFHRWSGYILAACITGHVFGTRGHDWLFGSSDLSGFQVVQFTMDKFPGFAMMYPYYIVFGCSGVIHGTFGFVRAVEILLPPLRSVVRSLQSGYLIEAFEFAVCAGIVAGVSSMGGVFGPRAPTDQYAEIGKFYEYMLGRPV